MEFPGPASLHPRKGGRAGGALGGPWARAPGNAADLAGAADFPGAPFDAFFSRGASFLAASARLRSRITIGRLCLGSLPWLSRLMVLFRDRVSSMTSTISTPWRAAAPFHSSPMSGLVPERWSYPARRSPARSVPWACISSWSTRWRW